MLNRIGILVVAAACLPWAWAQQPCAFTLSPASASVQAGGGTGSITVTASAPNCAWTAVSSADWISVTFGASGLGNGVVSYAVQPNPLLSARTGSINIGGQVFSISQAAGSCTFDLSSRSASFGPSGGTGSFHVTSQAGCTWSAVSGAPWVTVTSGASSTGTATVVFSVSANPTPTVRSTTIIVGNQTFTVTQSASSCLSLSSSSASVPATGGSSGFNVVASAECAWTAISNAEWLTITSGASGVGSGAVVFTAAPNPAPNPRTGTITVGGSTFTVTQAANVCYTLSATSAAVPSTGGTVSISVTATAGCTWSAVSGAEWLTITSGAAGAGPGVVVVAAAPNPTGAQRTGTIAIGNQMVTITQAGACVLTLNPTSGSFPATGGTGTIGVTASGGGCERQAVSNVPWITITSGASGSGSGTIGYTVAANTSPEARTGTITVSGLTYTVTQAATTCSIILSPATRAFPVSGGSGVLTITTSCSWTAVSRNPDWLQIASAASGTGNGSITYWVAANPSSEPRIGSIVVNDQGFTVSQPGVSCGVTLAVASASFPANGGPGSVEVTASPACAWTAASSVGWIAITSGTTYAGDAEVTFSVLANTTAQTRAGSIIIGNQVFTVTQSGLACEFSLSSTGATVPASGGSGSFNVISGCSWNAISNARWITITAGASGTGDGPVSYSVEPNPGTAPRIGTINVADKVFTISQPGVSCTISLSQTSVTVPGVAGTGVLNVTAPSGCSWTPTSDSEWLKIVSWSSVSGSGTVNYSYPSNPSQTPRSAMITVAGQTFTVTQGPAEVRVAAVANAASGARGSIAPGLIVAIAGLGMGPAKGVSAEGNAVPLSLAGTRVLFDDIPAPVLFASETQVNAVAPYALDGKTSVRLVVEYQGVRSAPMPLNMAPAAPGLFTLDSSGLGPAAALNENYSVNSAANPAAKDSVVILYATGEGQTSPPGIDGRLATADALPQPVLPVSVLIGGVDAPVLYAGGAPGMVAGVMQINVRVPPRAPSGSAVPVVLRVGRFESQPGVTLAVK